MRIRIGNQSAFSAERLLAPFEFAVEHRFDAFEFFPDRHGAGVGWTEQDLDDLTRADIRRIAAERGMRLSIHANLQSNLATAAGRSALQESLRLAQDLDARIINVHLDLSRGMDAFVDGVLSVVDELGTLGIDLSIENTPLTGPDVFNELFRRLHAQNVRQCCDVGVCLDLGHANLCEVTRNDYLRFIDALDATVPISHVHAHENHGDHDSHLTLFTGPSAVDPKGVAGWLERMHARGFSGSVILEQWPNPPSLLVAARDRLVAMAASIQAEAPEPEQDASLPPSLVEVVAEIADADRRRPSWRQKLSWVETFLSDTRRVPDVDSLAYVAIYLRFVGTGEVRCEEGGGHYRPCHHARISGRILHRLAELTTPETAFAIRRIQPWLPSVNETFTRAEPLTRIRDIAHRNDIPHGLKQEIKVTLQNKLHRNAGPEDLQTSAALLARFLANPSNYPTDFVAEFRRFHAELEEFFHALSLRDQLRLLEPSATPEQLALVRGLLDRMDTASTEVELVEMHSLVTKLRFSLGIESDSGTAVDAQLATLTEIRLEEFAFTVLSRLNNALASREAPFPWQLALTALIDLLEGLVLGEVEPEDCVRIVNELGRWRVDFDERDDWQLLRLAASIERARRVSVAFAAGVQRLFTGKIEELGSALGVDPMSRKLLAEAEIRTHPVFQLSRLCGVMLSWAHGQLNVDPWDVVAPGRAVGRLRFHERLADVRSVDDKRIIALLENVEGDEELPPALAGFLVANDVPHLSHLAIRARQLQVVMACARDRSAPLRARSMEGLMVVLDTATPAEGLLRLATQSEVPEPPRPPSLRSPEVPATPIDLVRMVQPLEETTVETGGAKAATCRKLLQLAGAGRQGFRAPSGMVVPFGVMEYTLRSNRSEERQFADLVARLHARPQEAEAIANELRELVRQVKVPIELTQSVIRRFGDGARLMVRSSASVEDLPDGASAGLYETVANVEAAEVASAIRDVWASLWAPRAVMGRVRYNDSPDAHMAVLIQRMVPSDYAFVVHTINPVNRFSHEVYIELVVGMGESVARGDSVGTPYRVAHDQRRDQVRTLAFESLSQARRPAEHGGLERVWLDHAAIQMSTDRSFQESAARRIAGVSRYLAKQLRGPQDIEGALVEENIVIVQCRPQQGLGRT